MNRHRSQLAPILVVLVQGQMALVVVLEILQIRTPTAMTEAIPPPAGMIYMTGGFIMAIIKAVAAQGMVALVETLD
jgi:hypothetical protein